MTESDVHAEHTEPYQSFKFRIMWDGRYVAGINRMSALRWMTEVVEHREGADPNASRRGPGQTRYEPITLEKGLSEDNVFETWANQVPAASVGGIPEPALRKDLRIEIYDEAGNRALAYTVYRCWPSEFQALPALDGAATGSLLQVLKLEHEGWERDLSITASAEAPTFE